VPNKRSSGKKLIGAQASPELRAAIDRWLVLNPGKSVTNFLLAACVEKLKSEKIPVEAVDIFRDLRARKPTYPTRSVSYFELNEKMPKVT